MPDLSELRASDPEANVSRLEASYEAESSFRPELDLPLSAEATPRARAADGKFLPTETRPAAPVPYQHHRTVAQLARDLGYSDDEIGQTPPDILDDRVYHVHRRTVELLAAERQARGPGIHAANGSSQPVPTPAPVVEEEPDLSYLDEGLQKFLKKQSDTIKALKGELDGQQQQVVARTQEQQTDKLFDELGRKDLFGSGSIRELAEEGSERDRRLAVVNKAKTLSSGTWKQKLQTATERLFGKAGSAGEESAYDAPRDSLQRRREEWDDHGPTARPTNRKPGPLPPMTRAAMKANELMKENPQILGDFSDDREP